jgi:riboflavin kinase/FMN adenylyltransferase
VECHALDLRRDLYDREASIGFLIRLREERRFPDRNALVAQIRRDVQRAERYFKSVERLAPALAEGWAGAA